jgi:hypothetical protein
VAGDLHAHHLRHAISAHVSDGSSSKIVEVEVGDASGNTGIGQPPRKSLIGSPLRLKTKEQDGQPLSRSRLARAASMHPVVAAMNPARHTARNSTLAHNPNTAGHAG